MIKAIVTINLTLTGPILTQSSSPSALGLDMVAARNAEGYFYLPGTLLVGKLRQALQELESAVKQELELAAKNKQDRFKPEFVKWLGEANENDVPNTKQLYFSDLVYQGDEDANAILNRIEIDEERGAVAENQLVVIESPFLTGKDYDFTGELHFFANNQKEVNKIVRHVEAGLHWTAQLGAMRTVGFGRVKHVNCSTIIKELAKPDLQAQLPAVEKFTLVIRPRYPFCITDKPVADNLFESLAIIPGAMILGSIVTTWNHLCGKSGGRTDDINDQQRIKLKDYFSLIRISHALPSAENGTRPITLPLSLVKIPTDKKALYDVILLDDPCLIDDETPAFAIDWKEDANSDYGWPQITKELRTRTHIDPETLRSADKDLFSYEQIAPKSLNWNAVVDLSRILDDNDRNKVVSELQSLLSEGIAALSKTKTPASIEWSELPIKATRASDTKPINDKQWIITLQTDTLLGAPINLNESSGLADLKDMYKTAWSELSDNKLELVRYFARQRLSGGNYRHHVFKGKDKQYQPWLLTEAGSVFLLQSAENASTEECQQLIEDWLAHGLPLKGQVLNYYGIVENEKGQWKTCPFIPQNGYGEIAVNLQLDNITQLTDDSERITLIHPVLEDSKNEKS